MFVRHYNKIHTIWILKLSPKGINFPVSSKTLPKIDEIFVKGNVQALQNICGFFLGLEIMKDDILGFVGGESK